MTHLPAWAHDKCKVIKVWKEPCSSGTATGVRTQVEFVNAKGKTIVMTKWVRWDVKSPTVSPISD